MTDTTTIYLGDTPLTITSDTTPITIQILTCACLRDLNFADYRAICPSSTSDAKINSLLPHINNSFRTYEIKSCMQKSHALAQILHESGDLRLLAEGVSDAQEQASYGGYKGRGLIQITGSLNYAAYGAYKGQNFLGANRLQLEQPEFAADSAGWFWKLGNNSNLNLNDMAAKNDFIAITVVINGGLNGFKPRKLRLLKLFQLLNVTQCLSFSKQSYPDIENVNQILSFQHSWIYAGNNKVKKGGCFAWGYWQDPHYPHINHMDVSSTDSKEGYLRYLEVTASSPLTSARYGLGSVTHMNQVAYQGSQ